MCDICQKIRCPRACPSYDESRSRDDNAMWREGMSFGFGYENNLESRMIDERKTKGKVGADETKNKM